MCLTAPIRGGAYPWSSSAGQDALPEHDAPHRWLAWPAVRVLVQSLNLGPIWQASDSLSPRAPGSARRPLLKFAPEPLTLTVAPRPPTLSEPPFFDRFSQRPGKIRRRFLNLNPIGGYGPLLSALYWCRSWVRGRSRGRLNPLELVPRIKGWQNGHIQCVWDALHVN